jgi:hypothetical protein
MFIQMRGEGMRKRNLRSDGIVPGVGLLLILVEMGWTPGADIERYDCEMSMH